MDAIHDSPLNKAHYYNRRADQLAQRGLFDDACENHELAAVNLLEALKLTNNSLALESIELQRLYHLKKQEILRIKKKQFLAVKEAFRVQKEVMSRVLKVSKKDSSDDGDGSLQKAIYKTFDEADSLLELLVHKKDGQGERSVVVENISAFTGTAGSKKPKDDSVVIEELRIVNYQLRSLITQLMTELASSEKQVSVLKKRVAELEACGAGSTCDLPPSCDRADSVASSTTTFPCTVAEEVIEDLPLLKSSHS